MIINFGNLERIGETMNDGMQNVCAAFDSEWEDTVHESFSNYVTEARRRIDTIAEEMDRVMNLRDECASIDIGALDSEFESIRTEAMSF